MRRLKSYRALSALLGGLALAPVGTALAAKPVERLSALAVDMSNMAGARNTATVDIVIDRWSTDAERDTLRAALREGGPEGLLKALQKVKEVGRISSEGSLGYPLRFARQAASPSGGRRIILGTDGSSRSSSSGTSRRR
jgi:hypothetical protein